MQHRTRDLLVRQRTQVINVLRAHLAELGITAAQGREGLKALLAVIADERDERLIATSMCFRLRREYLDATMIRLPV